MTRVAVIRGRGVPLRGDLTLRLALSRWIRLPKRLGLPGGRGLRFAARRHLRRRLGLTACLRLARALVDAPVDRLAAR
jgi:hypothetical protein